MAQRKSKKSVIVCAARKLAEAIWRLFAWGESFDLAKAFGGAHNIGDPSRVKPSRRQAKVMPMTTASPTAQPA